MSQSGWLRGFGIVLALFAFQPLSAGELQATIIDSGSTNRPGLRVIIDPQGHATVIERNGETHHIKLPEQKCGAFLHSVKSAAPLSDLPAHHCFKSVSFGSSLFIEYQGQRSPDLSCPGQQNSDSAALQKEAREILQAARSAAGIRGHEVFTTVKPH